jgi:hypothetical protein
MPPYSLVPGLLLLGQSGLLLVWPSIVSMKMNVGSVKGRDELSRAVYWNLMTMIGMLFGMGDTKERYL